MAKSGRLMICFIALLALLASGNPAQADPGKDLFDKLCASCHSIGGGDGGGPDLKGIVEKRPADWLVKVIVEPDKLTAAKDPLQAELVKKSGYEMPNLGISPDDAKKIITFLTETGGITATVTTPEKAETPVTPELIAQGKALFTGSLRMAKGGAPCISCHTLKYQVIAGGNLSTADLSTSYHKMGDTGMKGALKSLKFPTMKKIYADRPLTDDEIAALMALFKDSAAGKGGECTISLPLTGGVLFVLLLLGLTLYKRRIR
ncbi:MAG: cytochrome c [Geobacteraceae bacterium]|nr:cytochrome c [Geobacteraceae bacterium]NTW79266.1 cytochrome c [Geobacteraceae bacterium]